MTTKHSSRSRRRSAACFIAELRRHHRAAAAAAAAQRRRPQPELTACRDSNAASARHRPPAATAAQTARRTSPHPLRPLHPLHPKRRPRSPAYTRTDLQVGTGREAQKGKGLSVHYTGWLYDPAQPDMKGRMFDSSKDRGPFNFVLGAGQVIPGWDQGFDGMKIGGRRRLIIPPALALRCRRRRRRHHPAERDADL